MDTVYNNEQGPYIQTFIFEHTSFMIGILHREKTSVSMSNAITLLQENLGTDFNKLFSLLLTDRGSEFQKSELFEINVQTGESRCNIFYCDAQTPIYSFKCIILTICKKSDIFIDILVINLKSFLFLIKL